MGIILNFHLARFLGAYNDAVASTIRVGASNGYFWPAGVLRIDAD